MPDPRPALLFTYDHDSDEDAAVQAGLGAWTLGRIPGFDEAMMLASGDVQATSAPKRNLGYKDPSPSNPFLRNSDPKKDAVIQKGPRNGPSRKVAHFVSLDCSSSSAGDDSEDVESSLGDVDRLGLFTGAAAPALRNLVVGTIGLRLWPSQELRWARIMGDVDVALGRDDPLLGIVGLVATRVWECLAGEPMGQGRIWTLARFVGNNINPTAQQSCQVRAMAAGERSGGAGQKIAEVDLEAASAYLLGADGQGAARHRR